MLPEAQLAALSALSSPTVANILSLLGVSPKGAGYADARIRSLIRPAKPVVGYAVTATCRSAAPSESDPARIGTDALIQQCADIPSPRLIVIEDMETEPRSAICGEVLSNAFCHSGYIGLITNGAVRDLAQLESLAWPCWASGVSAGFAGGGYLSCRQPVGIAGLTVQTGDLIHADVNGVVRIPSDAAALVCQLGPRYDAIEQRCIDRLKCAKCSPEKVADALDELRNALAGLRREMFATAASLNTPISGES